ncbi:hypothetical protein A3711_02065 [Erythrobacter sp. HI00D59]|nr:hypothetical protein A3711_02065 [Erythrobacter sp. HI00D59]
MSFVVRSRFKLKVHIGRQEAYLRSLLRMHNNFKLISMASDKVFELLFPENGAIIDPLCRQIRA